MPENKLATAQLHHAVGHDPKLTQADHDGSLARFSAPDLTPPEAVVAWVEGWILGVS